MARWEPGARERLQAAALELFATRGFEQVTAAEIAQSVGLTERTFFRHFSDKREVLFHGQQRLVQAFLASADSAPAGASPIDVVTCALLGAAAFFPDDNRAFSRTRQSIIDRNPALHEREVQKLASIAGTLAEALRARGIDEVTAALAAHSALTVFGIAFAQWIRDGEERPFAEISTEVLRTLLALSAEATALG